MRITPVGPMNLDERNEHFAGLDMAQLRSYMGQMNAMCSHHDQVLKKATAARDAADREFRLRSMSN